MFRGATGGQKARRRLGWTLIALLVPGLLLSGCAQNAAGRQQQILPLATEQARDGYLSTLPTAEVSLPSPLASPSPVEVLPSPSASPLPVDMLPSQLVVLHTNDNWGETEPCG